MEGVEEVRGHPQEEAAAVAQHKGVLNVEPGVVVGVPMKQGFDHLEGGKHGFLSAHTALAPQDTRQRRPRVLYNLPSVLADLCLGVHVVVDPPDLVFVM